LVSKTPIVKIAWANSVNFGDSIDHFRVRYGPYDLQVSASSRSRIRETIQQLHAMRSGTVGAYFVFYAISAWFSKWTSGRRKLKARYRFYMSNIYKID